MKTDAELEAPNSFEIQRTEKVRSETEQVQPDRLSLLRPSCRRPRNLSISRGICATRWEMCAPSLEAEPPLDAAINKKNRSINDTIKNKIITSRKGNYREKSTLSVWIFPRTTSLACNVRSITSLVKRWGFLPSSTYLNYNCAMLLFKLVIIKSRPACLMFYYNYLRKINFKI